MTNKSKPNVPQTFEDISEILLSPREHELPRDGEEILCEVRNHISEAGIGELMKGIQSYENRIERCSAQIGAYRVEC